MDGSYPISLGGQTVGEAAVRREGLYLRFSCRCRFSGEMIYRLMAQCGSTAVNLGIPVPEGEWFRLDTRIAAKTLGSGALTVHAIPKHGQLRGKFVPLAPEEPFAYLARMKNAFLEIRNGQTGIVIAEDDQSI